MERGHQAAGSAPSQATVLPSVQAIVWKISELKTTMEIAERVATVDVKKLDQVAAKRTNEWSVIDCVPRTWDRLMVGSALCRFCQKGRRKSGGEWQVPTRGTWRACVGYAMRPKSGDCKTKTMKSDRVIKKQ